jgi:hypothetical protein
MMDVDVNEVGAMDVSEKRSAAEFWSERNRP